MNPLNTLRRWWNDQPPCNLYDIPALEAWLADQARRGRSLSVWPDLFEKAEPCECRFSIQPTPKNEDRPWTGPSPERREAYLEAGWEYVCVTDYNAFQVWRSARPDAEELNTDPVADSYAYRHLWKEMRLRNSIFLLLLLLFDAFCVWILYQSGHILLDIIMGEELTLLLVFWGTIAICNTVIRARELYILKKTMENLENGFPMTERRAYSKWKRVPVKIRAALTVTLCMLIFTVMPTEREVEKIKDMKDPPPYVALEDLGGVKDGSCLLVYRKTLFGGETIHILQGKWGLVGPFNRMCQDTQTDIYSLGLLSRPILWEVVHGYVREDAGASAEPFEQEVFDEAYYLRSVEGVQHLAVREGGKVLYFRTTAPADLRERLEEVREMMEWKGAYL